MINVMMVKEDLADQGVDAHSKRYHLDWISQHISSIGKTDFPPTAP